MCLAFEVSFLFALLARYPCCFFSCSEAISLPKSPPHPGSVSFANYNYIVFCDPVQSVKCIFLVHTDSVSLTLYDAAKVSEKDYMKPRESFNTLDPMLILSIVNLFWVSFWLALFQSPFQHFETTLRQYFSIHLELVPKHIRA